MNFFHPFDCICIMFTSTVETCCIVVLFQLPEHFLHVQIVELEFSVWTEQLEWSLLNLASAQFQVNNTYVKVFIFTLASATHFYGNCYKNCFLFSKFVSSVLLNDVLLFHRWLHCMHYLWTVLLKCCTILLEIIFGPVLDRCSLMLFCTLWLRWRLILSMFSHSLTCFSFLFFAFLLVKCPFS